MVVVFHSDEECESSIRYWQSVSAIEVVQLRIDGLTNIVTDDNLC